MSNDGHNHPGASGSQNGQQPPTAEQWLEARHAASATNGTANGANGTASGTANENGQDQRSPFARGRGTTGATPPPPPPPTPVVDADDPTSLPIFAGAWAADDQPTGRTRSGFALRPLLDAAPEAEEDDLDEVELDWDLIAEYRDRISSQLTSRLELEGGRVTDEEREQMGIDVIEEFVRSEAESRVSTGQPPWSSNYEKALKPALNAALFGLGRLEPLVKRTDIENIIIIARGLTCHVWLENTDGVIFEVDPIAESEDELRQFLAELGARQNRPFTEAIPKLHLRLAGGARLAAAWNSSGTSVVIRLHRLIDVSLDDMVHTWNACSPVLGDFLAATVRAGKSIVVSGVQGAGKTTWVRALCSAMQPWEMLGTFETELELHLHELTDRHKIVHAWEHRPGSGEIGPNGRPAGEFTTEEALHDSFRFILARQIVGEVRGPEVWNMIKAMESGPGSISTTHARSAALTIEKLVSCAMEAGPQVSRELAISKLAAAIDIVMYARTEIVAQGDGTYRKRRWIEEVLVVRPSMDAARGYQTAPIFASNQLGHAVATGQLESEFAQDLVRHGFDLGAYNTEVAANPGVASQ
ncbi:CpaF family protein [Nocardioides currus]|uniref:Secretion protein n=1 Tax=Nocardioides currus TaxID=2133958 RepID=A0A2R7YSX0_9ACTN|nr:ATPase, T2SS/T4P/T4SS family [Nocardioides currus]PUA79472.1 secretion protein [Nocardioides currus]